MTSNRRNGQKSSNRTKIKRFLVSLRVYFLAAGSKRCQPTGQGTPSGLTEEQSKRLPVTLRQCQTAQRPAPRPCARGGSDGSAPAARRSTPPAASQNHPRPPAAAGAAVPVLCGGGPGTKATPTQRWRQLYAPLIKRLSQGHPSPSLLRTAA